MSNDPSEWKAGSGYKFMRTRADVIATTKPIYCRCGCGQLVPLIEAMWGVRYFSTSHRLKVENERQKEVLKRKAAKRV